MNIQLSGSTLIWLKCIRFVKHLLWTNKRQETSNKQPTSVLKTLARTSAPQKEWLKDGNINNINNNNNHCHKPGSKLEVASPTTNQLNDNISESPFLSLSRSKRRIALSEKLYLASRFTSQTKNHDQRWAEIENRNPDLGQNQSQSWRQNPNQDQDQNQKLELKSKSKFGLESEYQSKSIHPLAS